MDINLQIIIGAAIGAFIGSAITSITQILTSKNERKDRYRMLVIEQRLTTQQKAFSILNKVIGWHMDRHRHKELVVEAMKKAVSSRSLWIRKEGELIFHSDQGVQYASDEFRRVLINNNIMQSMSSRGDCYDNAVTESFFHSLKTEWVSFHRYLSREEARLSIFHYIELFYNTRRFCIHQ